MAGYHKSYYLDVEWVVTIQRNFCLLQPRFARLQTMPCVVLLLVLFSPRIALLLMWFFSTYLQRAFHAQILIPLLGFIFLPLTTLVYAWEINNHMPIAGINLLWLLIAAIIDLGGLGGGASRRSRA